MTLSRSYRKLKISPDEQCKEAAAAAEVFEPLWAEYEKRRISGAEFCTKQVFWYHQRRRAPLPWISPQGHLLGLPQGIQRALRGFQTGDYTLEVRRAVPSPLDMLSLQADGRRCITVFVTEEECSRLYGGKEPFEFTLHDLEHADRFFVHPDSHRLQQIFFKELHRRVRAGEFAELAHQNPPFASKLEYLMSDMNSHPEHLRLYLQAITREAQAALAKSPVAMSL